MLEPALIAFTTFLATIGPQDVAILFLALTAKASADTRRRTAVRAVVIAALILAFFAILGRPVLTYMGITLPALRTAGGILLLLVAIDLVFARNSGVTSTTEAENAESATRNDVSVFPLATPLIAGPGTIGAVILLIADAHGDARRIAAVVGALAAVLVLTYVLMTVAAQVQKRLGVTGVHVLSRVFGILLAALAVQFLFDGIRASGLIGGGS
ncbi:MAG: antibiotic resistance protein MarC [Rhodospirillales bacterium CG15_BIG_FIL_POST_REV_8_21_14_020_66_15]|nr:MAG: antibiotic resistance protein MarC [Rhodospirillales bacterium CG15_BIG_FIL_POST_REV_8_21_14_020_66_15]